MMITVLLTEDEDFIREALVRQIPWPELGVDTVLQAENGEKALEILSSQAVDIVITDIQMDDITGLDICRFVSENKPYIKVIIITGFGNMEYAKSAIKYSASYFVLKPIDPDELMAAISDCVAKINTQRVKEQEIQDLQEKYQREKYAFSEKFLSDMADEALVDENYIDQSIHDLNLSAESYYCITYVSDLDNVQSSKNQREIARLIHENGLNAFYKDRVLYILYGTDTPGCSHVVRLLAELIEQHEGGPCFFGVSRVFNRLLDLSQACHEAYAAANLSFMEKTEKAMSFGACIEKYGLNAENIDAYSPGIAYSIMNGEEDNAWQEFNTFSKAILIREIKITQIKKCFVNFVIQLYEIFTETGFPFSQRMNITEEVTDILQRNTWKEIYEYLHNLILRAIGTSKDISNKSDNIVISKIKQYIQQHLSQTITLEELSREVYLTPKYISALVRKNTGITITEMITEARIEKAKELLRDFTLKTYEVAAQIGINDPQYFSQMFKRATGMTPKDYRRKMSI